MLARIPYPVSAAKPLFPRIRGEAALPLLRDEVALLMPTVLRIGPYRFHFYSRENLEPPHIHVARDDQEAKFWLSPVSLAKNYGFSTEELRGIEKHVILHQTQLLNSWAAYHENN